MSDEAAKGLCWLVLEDGSAFPGRSFGALRRAAGEVVFHTGMTGYQEILTDPSYRGQIVVLTAPQIGNTGVNPEDAESDRVQAEGVIVRELAPRPRSWRATDALGDWLAAAGLPGVEGVDTRALTLRLRERGSLRGVVVPASTDVRLEVPGWWRRDPAAAPDPAIPTDLPFEPSAALLELAEEAAVLPPMEGRNLVDGVSCSAPWRWGDRPPERPGGPRVIVYDFGVKWSILQALHARGCEVTVVPASTPPEEVLERQPDGVVLSNGPGDPATVAHGVAAAGRLAGRIPLLAICLGHQLVALAAGARTFKLRFGHHGANHPVRVEATGAVEITSQNHGFAVDPDGLEAGGYRVTHTNLNDGTVEGLCHRDWPVIAVQYHPEAAPGPRDATPIFDEFVGLASGASIGRLEAV